MRNFQHPISNLCSPMQTGFSFVLPVPSGNIRTGSVTSHFEQSTIQNCKLTSQINWHIAFRKSEIVNLTILCRLKDRNICIGKLIQQKSNNKLNGQWLLWSINVMTYVPDQPICHSVVLLQKRNKFNKIYRQNSCESDKRKL